MNRYVHSAIAVNLRHFPGGKLALMTGYQWRSRAALGVPPRRSQAVSLPFPLSLRAVHLENCEQYSMMYIVGYSSLWVAIISTR